MSRSASGDQSTDDGIDAPRTPRSKEHQATLDLYEAATRENGLKDLQKVLIRALELGLIRDRTDSTDLHGFIGHDDDDDDVRILGLLCFKTREVFSVNPVCADLCSNRNMCEARSLRLRLQLGPGRRGS